jgi:hypothetical protein
MKRNNLSSGCGPRALACLSNIQDRINAIATLLPARALSQPERPFQGFTSHISTVISWGRPEMSGGAWAFWGGCSRDSHQSNQQAVPLADLSRCQDVSSCRLTVPGRVLQHSSYRRHSTKTATDHSRSICTLQAWQRTASRTYPPIRKSAAAVQQCDQHS